LKLTFPLRNKHCTPMPHLPTRHPRAVLRTLLLVGLSLLGHAEARADTAAGLRESYASLGAQLRQNAFGRALVLDSSETAQRVQGEIHAVIDAPFELVGTGLNSPAHWCEVMILHINTKSCRAVADAAGARTLQVHVGKKTPQPLADTDRLDFSYRVAAASPDYLEILLQAEQGLLGTSDYRIRLAAVALPGSKTFLHLSYAYTTHLAARLALQTYLHTAGRDKVGFSVTGTGADGQPERVGGMRGMVERNTMRYYLAIEAWLAAEQAAPGTRLEHRLQGWFTAVEKYPRQLHEMDRAPYLAMKRAEAARQMDIP